VGLEARRGVVVDRRRLSDKTSRLRPRHVAPELGQTHEPEGLVEVAEWKLPPLLRLVLCLERSHRRNRTAVYCGCRTCSEYYDGSEISLLTILSRLTVLPLLSIISIKLTD
jgi:hypothetical protein